MIPRRAKPPVPSSPPAYEFDVVPVTRLEVGLDTKEVRTFDLGVSDRYEDEVSEWGVGRLLIIQGARRIFIPQNRIVYLDVYPSTVKKLRTT